MVTNPDENPDPDRISDAVWRWLWLAIRDHYGEAVRLGVPTNGSRLGYHLTRAEHKASNYSVTRPVDKLGPADRVAAVDWSFPAARLGDFELITRVTRHLLDAYDSHDDGRIGPHNLAEIFGTLDGRTVVGRIHGRYSSHSDAHLYVVHVALARRWAENDYVARSVASVVTGESHAEWLRREHPRIRGG